MLYTGRRAMQTVFLVENTGCTALILPLFYAVNTGCRAMLYIYNHSVAAFISDTAKA